MYDVSLVVSIAIAVGVIGQLIANVLQIPGIVILLLLGVGLGHEGLGLIDTTSLGNLLPKLVGSSVAIILFEGALNLNFKHLKQESKVINRLITSGAVISAVGGAMLTRYILEWSWSLSLLFGFLVVVTGPTVVTPLLRRLNIRKNVRTILDAEAVLIDPIGAILALVALEVIVAKADGGFALGMMEYAHRMGFGAVVGACGGFALAYLLKNERIVPDDYSNIVAFAGVLLLFNGCNAVFPESGILAVTVAGLIVGNLNVPIHKELLEFKEQLTVMLIGMLFILLSADIRLQEVRDLGVGGVLVTVLLVTVVRPIEVLWSTRGSNLNWREKAFISWVSPRGIVAAAVATLFANALDHAGIEGGAQIRGLVFLVIATTVLIQGILAGPIASLLGVRQVQSGYLVVGAHSVGRAIATLLRKAGEEVVLLDRNIEDCIKAEKQGLSTVMGDAISSTVLERAYVDAKAGVLAITTNDSLNLTILKRCRYLSKKLRSYFVTKSQLFEGSLKRAARAIQAFSPKCDIGYWSQVIDRSQGKIVKVKVKAMDKLRNAREPNSIFSKQSFRMLPIISEIKGVRRPFSLEELTDKIDHLFFLVHEPSFAEVEQELEKAGLTVTESSTPG